MADLQSGHTPEDFDGELHSKAIIGFGIGVVVLLVSAFLLMMGMNGIFEHKERGQTPKGSALAAEHGEIVPPAPRLQNYPELDLEAMREHEATDLASYRLLDAEAGIVALPIDEATRRILAEGMPSWDAPAVEETP